MVTSTVKFGEYGEMGGVERVQVMFPNETVVEFDSARSGKVKAKGRLRPYVPAVGWVSVGVMVLASMVTYTGDVVHDLPIRLKHKADA